MFKLAIIIKLHKIASIVVGIQVLLWVVSGLYMTAVPLNYVHGDHLRHENTKRPLEIQSNWLSPVAIKDLFPNEQITNISLFSRLNKGTYLIEIGETKHLIDAQTGQIVAPLTRDEAISIAKKAHTSNISIVSAALINSYSAVPEIKGRPLPIWQVKFDDWANSTLYVSNTEAKVITARSDIWRVFDFLWMLHIMDYDEREDFNNPLVIFMASLAMLLVLTGIILLTKGFKRSGRRYLK